MARILGETIDSMLIDDPRSDGPVMFYYSPPDNKQLARYQAETGALIRVRHRGKVDVKGEEMRNVRLKHGMRVLKGFRDGDFKVLREGRVVPIASREEAEGYYPDWRTLVEAYASDLVLALVMRVFDGASVIEEEGEEEETAMDDPREEDAPKNGRSRSSWSVITPETGG